MQVILKLSIHHDGNMYASEQGLESNCLDRLLCKCKELLFIDFHGFVQFAHPMLLQFVRICPIRGIDKSHATIATACVKQVEKMPANSETQQTTAQPSFATYSMSYWTDHYRRVQNVSQNLTRRMIRLLANPNPLLRSEAFREIMAEDELGSDCLSSGASIGKVNLDALERSLTDTSVNADLRMHEEQLVKSSMVFASHWEPAEAADVCDDSDSDERGWEIVDMPMNGNYQADSAPT